MSSVQFWKDDKGEDILDESGEPVLDDDLLSETCAQFYRSLLAYDAAVLQQTRASTDEVEVVRSDVVASRRSKADKAAKSRTEYAKRRKEIAKKAKRKMNAEAAAQQFNAQVSRSLLQLSRQQQAKTRQFVDSFREKRSLPPLSPPPPLSPLPQIPRAIVISSSSETSSDYNHVQTDANGDFTKCVDDNTFGLDLAGEEVEHDDDERNLT
jgi:hypothetical protein